MNFLRDWTTHVFPAHSFEDVISELQKNGAQIVHKVNFKQYDYS